MSLHTKLVKVVSPLLQDSITFINDQGERIGFSGFLAHAVSLFCDKYENQIIINPKQRQTVYTICDWAPGFFKTDAIVDFRAYQGKKMQCPLFVVSVAPQKRPDCIYAKVVDCFNELRTANFWDCETEKPIPGKFMLCHCQFLETNKKEINARRGRIWQNRYHLTLQAVAQQYVALNKIQSSWLIGQIHGNTFDSGEIVKDLQNYDYQGYYGVRQRDRQADTLEPTLFSVQLVNQEFYQILPSAITFQNSKFTPIEKIVQKQNDEKLQQTINQHQQTAVITNIQEKAVNNVKETPIQQIIINNMITPMLPQPMSVVNISSTETRPQIISIQSDQSKLYSSEAANSLLQFTQMISLQVPQNKKPKPCSPSVSYRIKLPIMWVNFRQNLCYPELPRFGNDFYIIKLKTKLCLIRSSLLLNFLQNMFSLYQGHQNLACDVKHYHYLKNQFSRIEITNEMNVWVETTLGLTIITSFY